MGLKGKIGSVLLIFGCLISISVNAETNDMTTKHQETAMRMIGHQLLLLSGDSTSRVLPVSKEGFQYTISFENDFAFQPRVLIYVVDSVIDKTHLGSHYFVEVLSCDSNRVEYSYEIFDDPEFGIIPCMDREYIEGCFDVRITLMDPTIINDNSAITPLTSDESASSLNPGLIFVVIAFLLISGYFLVSKKKKMIDLPDHLIGIGQYHFDPRNLKLNFKDEELELTSKEADLLHLLNDEANSTVEREVILNKVWGDEGDYVGRTLDVFISKLRKKLQSDPNIKIINIRGVGYKMVVNEVAK